MRPSLVLALAGSVLLAVLLTGGAACNGGEDDGQQGGVPPEARVYALMLDMDVAWQPLLSAQKRDDFEAIRRHAETLARQARDPDFVGGREGKVWDNNVRLMQESADELKSAADAASVKAAVERLEHSCNECHRKFQ